MYVLHSMSIVYLQRKGNSVVKLHSARSPSKTLMIEEDEPLQVDNEEVWVAPNRESLNGSSVSLTDWAIPGRGDCDNRWMIIYISYQA